MRSELRTAGQLAASTCASAPAPPALTTGWSVPTDDLLFESSPDCVKLLDLRGTLLRMNRNGVCLMELASSEAVVGRPWAALWPAEERPRLERALAHARAGQSTRFQAFCPTAGGTPKWWDVQVTPVLDPQNGQIVNLLSVSRDVTELVGAKEELARSKAALERAVEQRTIELRHAAREQEAFAYAVAHDLRAPLMAIRGFSHALLSEPSQLSARHLHCARRIHLAALHMDQMAEGILALSKLVKPELAPDLVDLGLIARECLETLQAAEPQRVVRYTVATQLWAACDPRLVRVVLQNLLANAWKFTRSRAEAWIEVGSKLGPSNELRFFVRDNGIGFDAGEATRIFQPFYRLRPDEYEGSGIGLATVQRIILRHGGSIHASSSENAGATFAFTLRG